MQKLILINIFCIFLLTSYNNFSQVNNEDFFYNHIEYIDATLLPMNYEDEDKIYYKSFKNIIYSIYNDYKKNDSHRYFNLINHSDNSIQKIFIPDSFKIDIVNIKDFAINSDILAILLTNYNCLIYKMNKNNEYILDTALADYKFANVKIIDNYLFLYSYVINSGTKILRVDLKNNYKLKLKEFENPSGYEFTYFQPKHLMDIKQDMIVISELNNMKLYFYNWDFELVDSISYKPSNWVYNEKADYYFNNRYRDVEKANAKLVLDSLRPLIKEFSMIHKVFFVNSDKLLVFWSIPSNASNEFYNFHFSIFQKSDKWNLLYSDLENIQAIESKTLGEFLSKIFVTNNFIIDDNKIFMIVPIQFEINDELKKLSIVEFQSKMEKYFVVNEKLRYSVIKLRLK